MKQQVIKILKDNNQEQIIDILNKMNFEDGKNLMKQILELNFSEVNDLYNELKEGYKETVNKIEPINYTEKSKLKQDEISKFETIGKEVIMKNKLAVISLAGGQGTRLGHSGPKGTFELELDEVFGRKISIFEVLAQNFLNAKKLYNVDVNWYIMTSNENNEATVDFFENNNYFNLEKEQVKFFIQNDIPVIDENGKILVGSNYLIKTASNGNGGIYEVLDKQGILLNMKKNGIEWVFVSGVDNILVNPIDPLFVGLTIEEKNKVAVKTVKKVDANEKTGVYCKKDGKVGVIEYNEISDELRNARDNNNDLLYGQSNIVSHLYNIQALDFLKDVKIPYHIAHKKGSYINKNLEEIFPTEPNVYKFEKYIFDAFGKFEDVTILSVDRKQEFAPIKNAEGNDSPETATKLYSEYFKNKERLL